MWDKMNPPEFTRETNGVAPEFDGTEESLLKYIDYLGVEKSIDEIDLMLPEEISGDKLQRVWYAVTSYFI